MALDINTEQLDCDGARAINAAGLGVLLFRLHHLTMGNQ